MDGREDQIVLVEQRRAGLVAGGVRRIERQLGQEPLARRIARGDLLELHEIGLRALRRRRGCARRCGSYQRRTSSSSAGQPAAAPRSLPHQRRRTPASARRPRAGGVNSRERLRRHRPARRCDRGSRAAVAGPMPGSSCSDAEAGDAVARIFRPAQDRQHVLDVRGFEKLQAAEFDERNVAPGQLDFERAAVVRGAEQHRLRLQREPGLAARQHASRRRSAPGPPRRAR